jgi:hypothetical protein
MKTGRGGSLCRPSTIIPSASSEYSIVDPVETLLAVETFLKRLKVKDETKLTNQTPDRKRKKESRF